MAKLAKGIGTLCLMLCAEMGTVSATPAAIELQCAGSFTKHGTEYRDVPISGIYVHIDTHVIEISGFPAFDGQYAVTETSDAWVSFAESERADPDKVGMNQAIGRFGSINRLDGSLTAFLKNSGGNRMSSFIALECGALNRLF